MAFKSSQAHNHGKELEVYGSSDIGKGVGTEEIVLGGSGGNPDLPVAISYPADQFGFDDNDLVLPTSIYFRTSNGGSELFTGTDTKLTGRRWYVERSDDNVTYTDLAGSPFDEFFTPSIDAGSSTALPNYQVPSGLLEGSTYYKIKCLYLLEKDSEISFGSTPVSQEITIKTTGPRQLAGRGGWVNFEFETTPGPAANINFFYCYGYDGTTPQGGNGGRCSAYNGGDGGAFLAWWVSMPRDHALSIAPGSAANRLDVRLADPAWMTTQSVFFNDSTYTRTEYTMTGGRGEENNANIAQQGGAGDPIPINAFNTMNAGVVQAYYGKAGLGGQTNGFNEAYYGKGGGGGAAGFVITPQDGFSTTNFPPPGYQAQGGQNGSDKNAPEGFRPGGRGGGATNHTWPEGQTGPWFGAGGGGGGSAAETQCDTSGQGSGGVGCRQYMFVTQTFDDARFNQPGPYEYNGYYPLYLIRSQAEEVNLTTISDILLDGITFYMPGGVAQYFGNYSA